VIFKLKEVVELTLGELLLDGIHCSSSLLPQSGSSFESRLFERSKIRSFCNQHIDVGTVPVIELENRTAISNCGARKFGTNPVKEFLDMSNIKTVLDNLGIKPVNKFDCIESTITDMNSRLGGNSPLSWFKEIAKTIASEKVVQNQSGILPTRPVFEMSSQPMLLCHRSHLGNWGPK
jgi:hypothetical protein